MIEISIFDRLMTIKELTIKSGGTLSLLGREVLAWLSAAADQARVGEAEGRLHVEDDHVGRRRLPVAEQNDVSHAELSPELLLELAELRFLLGLLHTMASSPSRRVLVLIRISSLIVKERNVLLTYRCRYWWWRLK